MGDYGAKTEDVTRIAELAATEFVEYENEEGLNGELADGDLVFSEEYVKQLLGEMANAAFTSRGDDFCDYVSENRHRIWEMARCTPEVAEMLVLCYKMGIANGSAGCMNDLGALYYIGDLVEQDYRKAAELYEMAADGGCYQSIINLGYIYEYGRLGTADHVKAYQWYSLAAALAPSSEAIYKLGDMYSRGKAVPHDIKKAHRLYERSLRLATGNAEFAQPAARIAKMLIDPQAASKGVEPDPMRALALFQRAEIGLREDIADGQTYYVKRLQEVIEGQEKARALIGGAGILE